MDNITPFKASLPAPDPDVVVLRCIDPLQFDPTALNELFAEKTVDALQQGRDGSQFDQMFKPARRIGLIAEQIGLIEVAAAAGHVVNCLEQADGIALEATLARLERGFDVAVSEIWNYRAL